MQKQGRSLGKSLNIEQQGKGKSRQELVLPDNSYYLIFLTFFRSSVEVRSSVIVAAEENPEP